MQNENEEVINSTNDTDETVNETLEENDNSEKLSALEQKIKTLEAQKDHWRKKAEGGTDKSADKTVQTNATSLSAFDLIAIQNAGVKEEDELQEVMEYAKYKNISVSEALKSNIVKTTLKDMREFKQTSEASNTGPSRRGVSKPTDSSLIANASNGSLPDSEDDIARLVMLRMKK